MTSLVQSAIIAVPVAFNVTVVAFMHWISLFNGLHVK